MLAEAPLPADPAQVARRIRMRDHVEVVAAVLNEFFALTDDGWRHSRCDAEIAAVQSKSESARTSAAVRWHRERDANALRSQSEGNAPKTQDPRPKTQEEEQREGDDAGKPAPSARGCRIPDGFPGIDDHLWCREARPDLDAGEVGQKFRDYWAGVPGAKGRKLDWPATWRNFVRGERAPQARASPYRSAADAREERDAAHTHAFTGGFAGRLPQQPRTIDGRTDGLPALAGPRD